MKNGFRDDDIFLLQVASHAISYMLGIIYFEERSLILKHLGYVFSSNDSRSALGKG
jgi:hypothetical protein